MQWVMGWRDATGNGMEGWVMEWRDGMGNGMGEEKGDLAT